MRQHSRPTETRTAACKRRGILWLLVAGSLVALIITVAACGTQTNASTNGSTTPSPSSTTHLITSMGNAVGDVTNLTWDLPSGEPNTLDPTLVSWYNNALVDSNLCDTLTRLTPTGSIVPCIATKWTFPNSTTLVYTIRRGVKFWDGHPLTAADVAWSLQRTAAPASGFSVFFTNVKSIKATGPYQVTIRFKQPDSLFQKEIPSWVSDVLEKQWGEKAGKSIGTPQGGLMASGPFKLVKWTPGQGIELARNNSYWDPQYRAHAATVSIKFVTDSTAVAEGLASGEFDGVWEVPPSIIPRLRSTTTGRLYYGPSREFFSLSELSPGGPLKDVKLRLALDMCINRPALVKAIWNGAGYPGYTEMDVGSWDPSELSMWQQAYQQYVQAHSYNLTAAKQLVASTNYSGQPIVLITQVGDTTQAPVAEYIQAQAKLIGLNVVIKPLNAIQYADIWNGPQGRKGYDIKLGATYDCAQDPSELFDFDYLPGTPYDYTNFHTPQLTALLEAARGTFNNEQRAEDLIKAQQITEANQANTTLVEQYEVTYLNNKLSGMVTSFNYLFIPSLALIGAAK